MRNVTLLSLFLLLTFSAPSTAQTTAQLAAREAELRAAMPYTTMLAKTPGLTLEQYKAAIRSVAQEELRSASARKRPVSLPSAGVSSYPTYEAPAYATPTSVSSTSSRVGQFSYYSDSLDVTGTTTRIGPYTYSNYSNGVSATATQTPPVTNYSIRQPTTSRTITGTTTTIGPFQYHSLSNRVTGTTTQIGQFGFTSLSNGQRCTTTTIGAYTYTNCY